MISTPRFLRRFCLHEYKLCSALDEDCFPFCESYEARLTEEFLGWLNQSEVNPSSTFSADPFFSIIVPLYSRADQIE